MTEIERFAGPDVIKMLVGNKCDQLDKKVVDSTTAKVAVGSQSGLVLGSGPRRARSTGVQPNGGQTRVTQRL